MIEHTLHHSIYKEIHIENETKITKYILRSIVFNKIDKQTEMKETQIMKLIMTP